MANTFKGRVFQITPTETKTHEAKEYYSRQLTLLVRRYDPETGELQREDYPTFDISGEVRCTQLNGLKVGDLVEVSYVVQGVKYEKEGVTKFFNKVTGYKIEPINQTQPVQQAQPVQQYPQVSQATQAQPQNPSDDLPF